MLKYSYDVIIRPLHNVNLLPATGWQSSNSVNTNDRVGTLSIPKTELELCHPGQNIFNPAEAINQGEKNSNITTEEKARQETKYKIKYIINILV